MIGAGAFGCHQQKHNVDWTLVDRIEIDRLGETREQATGLGERGHASVRDRDAAANSGRAQALTLEQAIEQAALVELEDRRGAAGQFGQERFLAGRLYA